MDKGDRLARLLDSSLGENLEQLGVRSEIASLLGAGSATLPLWAGEIVSSTIDADLLDYLRRDSYFAGLEQNYDDRVFRYFTVAEGHLALHMTKHGMERPDARSEIVQLLRMRYFLTERVYYHHTKVVAGAMISKAVELALDEGALSENDLLQLNDWTLLDHLRRNGGADCAALIDGLAHRKLLKRGYVISAHRVPPAERAALVARYHESRSERRRAEEDLGKEIGCRVGQLIVYCPALTVMKEAAALVQVPEGARPLNEVKGNGFSEIKALEDRYESLWRFYVFVPPELASRTATAAAQWFGFPSEHICRA